ncbi:LPS-assembly lipoprotein LptE [Pelotalea chapellei]|uniref:LPS-assembly lipoprotein LptE n=1 Tax=Pelotalea chapellei TaxID=44671 RepID=A0ABS5U7K5_9BACT|nr:LPS assembly lipoprotein LptE [Pelotalea chapellei]MBT1071641.1 hypothetical protein [Pelotalea chapellei]
MILLRALLTIAIVMQLSGCGYHFSGSGDNTIATGQSIWVSFIRNESTSSIAQTVLRRALFEESHRLRGLFPAASESDAELVVNGTLRSYSSKAVSYTAADRAREYRLMLNVELEIRRKGMNSLLWKGSLQSYQDFPASDNLALQQNAEEAALVAASRIIAQKMLVASEQAY